MIRLRTGVLGLLLAAAAALQGCSELPAVNAFSAGGRAEYRQDLCAWATATQTTYSPQARSCLARGK